MTNNQSLSECQFMIIGDINVDLIKDILTLKYTNPFNNHVKDFVDPIDELKELRKSIIGGINLQSENENVSGDLKDVFEYINSKVNPEYQVKYVERKDYPEYLTEESVHCSPLELVDAYFYMMRKDNKALEIFNKLMKEFSSENGKAFLIIEGNNILRLEAFQLQSGYCKEQRSEVKIIDLETSHGNIKVGFFRCN